MFICVYMSMYVCMYVSTHVCVYVCVCRPEENLGHFAWAQAMFSKTESLIGLELTK